MVRASGYDHDHSGNKYQVRVLSFSLVGLVVVLSACRSPVSVTAPKCASGRATPISLPSIRAGLRDAGIIVSDDDSLCDRDAVSDLVTPSHDLSCSVYRRVVYPKMKAHPRMRYEGPNYSGKAYVVAFANVDCRVYGDGQRRAAIVGTLRGTFRRLGATSAAVGKY